MRLSSRAAKITPSETLAITAKANALKAQGRDVIGFLQREKNNQSTGIN